MMVTHKSQPDAETVISLMALCEYRSEWAFKV